MHFTSLVVPSLNPSGTIASRQLTCHSMNYDLYNDHGRRVIVPIDFLKNGNVTDVDNRSSVKVQTKATSEATRSIPCRLKHGENKARFTLKGSHVFAA